MTKVLILLLLWRWRQVRRKPSLHSPNEGDDLFDDLFALLVSETKRKFVFSRNRNVFHKSLSIDEKRLRQRSIPRSCLQSPVGSAWRQLYRGKCDQAMITFTGLSHQVFEELHSKFEPYYNTLSPHSFDGTIVGINSNKGRKRLFSSRDCLALSLSWTRTRGSIFTLSMIFGMTRTSMSMYLRFGRRILVHILKDEKSAKVVIPNDQKVEKFKEVIAEHHPSLRDVWATMDGLKLEIERSPNPVVENRFYNGWTRTLCD